MRGFAVPAVLAFVLQAFFGPKAIWFAVPVGELTTLQFVLGKMHVK